jgi:hypothetical protein
MIKRKLNFVEVFGVLGGYLKRLGFRWPKDPLLNLLVAVISLFLIIAKGNIYDNGAYK